MVSKNREENRVKVEKEELRVMHILRIFNSQGLMFN